jgi:hypothetical protein
VSRSAGRTPEGIRERSSGGIALLGPLDFDSARAAQEKVAEQRTLQRGRESAT